jgi:hypothetical protein
MTRHQTALDGDLNTKRAALAPLGVAGEDDEEFTCASCVWRKSVFAYW